MKLYLQKIYNTRYFWTHLAICELKARFRRTKLGLLWTILQPLFLTMIMAFVFSTIFRQPLGEYAMYILSGTVVWNLANASAIGGGNSILSAEQYIRQFNHPITIYTLRSSVLNIITFVIELIALGIWVLIRYPLNIFMGLLTLPLTAVLLFALSWGITTVAGYSGCKYRDYPQIMSLLMQALWYVSPVMFKKDIFETNQYMHILYEYNPVTHILNLIRNPWLYNKFPQIRDYAFTVITIIIFALWALYINMKNQKKIIFYL